MIVLQLLLLLVLLIVVPLAVGGLFGSKGRSMDNILYRWVSGQIMLWAVFQVICVPFVLLQKSFSYVVYLFSAASILLVICGLLVSVHRARERSRSNGLSSKRLGSTQADVLQLILWGIFGILLLLQLVLAVFLAYEEGDDAYYVAISTATVDSEQMYMKIAYTGEHTGLDARHGLAPFPVWVAYLAKLTAIPAVTMAQILLPLVLIVMTYAIYYLIGGALLEKHPKWRPVFMILIAVIVLFGGYSTYSAENFLLVRTSQGKAVIANIVIPFMIYELYGMLQNLEKGEKLPKKCWILLALAMVAGCLCSTLGSLLTCILLGIVGGCGVVCYRKWKLLMPMAMCCVVPAACALLYLMLD